MLSYKVLATPSSAPFSSEVLENLRILLDSLKSLPSLPLSGGTLAQIRCKGIRFYLPPVEAASLTFKGESVKTVEFIVPRNPLGIEIKTGAQSYYFELPQDHALYPLAKQASFLGMEILGGDQLEIHPRMKPYDHVEFKKKLCTSLLTQILQQSFQPDTRLTQLMGVIQQYDLKHLTLFLRLPSDPNSAIQLCQQSLTQGEYECLIRDIKQYQSQGTLSPLALFTMLPPALKQQLKTYLVDDWSQLMSDPMAALNYPQIYEGIAETSFTHIQEQLSQSSPAVIRIYSMGCGEGHDTWALCEKIRQDMAVNPTPYKGRQIKILMSDFTAKSLKEAENLKKQFSDIKNVVKVIIMPAFDMVASKPRVKDGTYSLITASGFFNQEVLEYEPSVALFNWAKEKLAPGGRMLLTGLTLLHFDRDFFEAQGFEVEQMVSPTVFQLIPSSVASEAPERGPRLQFYIIKKPL